MKRVLATLAIAVAAESDDLAHLLHGIQDIEHELEEMLGDEAPAPAPAPPPPISNDEEEEEQPPAPQPPPAPKPPVVASGSYTEGACTWVAYLDHDIAHHDLRSIPAKGKGLPKKMEYCRGECVNDPECYGFAYFKGGDKCELKSQVKTVEQYFPGQGHDMWHLKTPECKPKRKAEL